MPNTVTGTSGDDVLYGTYGSDIFYPGASVYGDTIYDPGGDDYYILESGFSFITDNGGTDVATMDQVLANLNFMIMFDTTVAIWSDDGTVGVWFENMVNNPTVGVDYLVLNDVTIGRDQILTYANEFFGLNL
jgi:Ca2+-binding RTX toxin-like protein